MTVPAESFDLHNDVKMLGEIVNDLYTDARELAEGYSTGPGLEPDIISLELIEAARSELANVVKILERVIAEKMPAKEFEGESGHAWEKQKRKSRTKWDREALLPDVLDSRIFDRYDGSLQDETPLDKVLMVWNLGAPRVTALRERGLDADQYCTTEDAGWSIRRIR